MGWFMRLSSRVGMYVCVCVCNVYVSVCVHVWSEAYLFVLMYRALLVHIWGPFFTYIWVFWDICRVFVVLGSFGTHIGLFWYIHRALMGSFGTRCFWYIYRAQCVLYRALLVCIHGSYGICTVILPDSSRWDILLRDHVIFPDFTPCQMLLFFFCRENTYNRVAKNSKYGTRWVVGVCVWEGECVYVAEFESFD